MCYIHMHISHISTWLSIRAWLSIRGDDNKSSYVSVYDSNLCLECALSRWTCVSLYSESLGGEEDDLFFSFYANTFVYLEISEI